MSVDERLRSETGYESVVFDLKTVLEGRPQIFRPVENKEVMYTVSEIIGNPFLVIKGMKSIHGADGCTIDQAKGILALNMQSEENRYNLYILPDLFREGIVHIFLKPKSGDLRVSVVGKSDALVPNVSMDKKLFLQMS